MVAKSGSTKPSAALNETSPPAADHRVGQQLDTTGRVETRNPVYELQQSGGLEDATATGDETATPAKVDERAFSPGGMSERTVAYDNEPLQHRHTEGDSASTTSSPSGQKGTERPEQHLYEFNTMSPTELGEYLHPIVTKQTVAIVLENEIDGEQYHQALMYTSEAHEFLKEELDVLTLIARNHLIRDVKRYRHVNKITGDSLWPPQ